LFSKEILGLIFFTNPEYMNGFMSLSILVIGMTFYSIYSISSSIVQGIGNPKIPMYLLIVGCIVTFILGWYMIPCLGIVGGALATTVSSVLMTVPMFMIQFRLTQTNPPYEFIFKVLVSSAVMGIPSFFLNGAFGLIIGLLICPVIYVFMIILLKTFSHEDIGGLRRLFEKAGPLNKYFNRFFDFMEKYGS